MKKFNLTHPLVSHLLAVITFIIVSLAATRPTIDNVSTRLVGSSIDTLASVWGNWFYREAVTGHISLDPITILFYPNGVPLSVMGGGLLTSIFSLLFSWIGDYEAYNLTYLFSMAATGYCTFLLARSLKMNTISSIFAGIAMTISPLILKGLEVGHLVKSFQGNMALYLLFLNQLAVDRAHVKRNVILGALSMLFCLLYDANYFIFAVIATAVFAVIKLVQKDKADRLMIFKRLAALTVVSLLVCSPFLFRMLSGYDNGDFNVKLADLASSASYSTDLAAYFLPNYYNTLFGKLSIKLVDFFPGFAPEVAVTIPLTLLFLSLVSLRKFEKKHLFFYLVFITFFLFAMGPYLRFLGSRVEINGSPILLPFFFLSKIPGFDFMRVPSRFMMMGYVGLAVTAGLGMNYLTQKFSKLSLVVAAVFLAALIVENWWMPFPEIEIPDTPQYYVELGENPEDFGVLDLPMTIPGVGEAGYDFGRYTSEAYVNYMLYQRDHHKGIAAGYVARNFLHNPVIETMDSKHSGLFSPPELTLAGERPAKFVNIQYELSRLNYRKVVWHKELFGKDYCRKPDSIAFIIGHGLCYDAVDTQQAEISAYLQQAFGSQAPEYDDGKTIVYSVGKKTDSDLIPNLQYDADWPAKEEGLQPVPSSAGIITEFPEDVTLRMKMVISSQSGKDVRAAGNMRFLIDGKIIGQSEILPTVELSLPIPKGMNKLIIETDIPPHDPEIQSADFIVDEIHFDYAEK